MYTYMYMYSDVLMYRADLIPDERPPLLRGHFCSAEGLAHQKG